MHRRRLFAALLLFMLSAYAFAATASDPIPHLLSADYAEVERLMQGVQDDYKRGAITDEDLLVAFRAFYFLDASQLHHLDRWIERFPKSYAAHLTRGIYYKQLGFNRPRYNSKDKHRAAMDDAHDLAARDLYASMELDDKPLLSYFHAIDLADPIGRRPAKRLLQAANEIDPDNFIVRHEFLLSLRPTEGGSVAEMRAFVADCKSILSPDRIRRFESTVMMAEARHTLDGRDDAAEAERLYRKVLAFDPENDSASWYLLYLLVNRKECTEAIAVATKLLAKPDSRAGEIAARRGWCYLRQNEIAEGVADFQRAAELGDVWAQKELAGLYWFGKHVARDVQLARHWMQKAAEQGDEEAQREMQRSFGVTIASPSPKTLPSWVRTALYAVGVLAVLALIVWWEYAERKASLDNRLVRYPPSYLVVGLIGTIGFGFVAWVGFWNAYLPWRSVAFVVPAVLTAMSLYLLIHRLMVRIELLSDGALYRGYITRELRLKWADLRSIRYNPYTHWFRLEWQSGDVVRISLSMTGLQPFARAVLVHAEQAIADDHSRALLEETSENWAALDESELRP